MASRLGGRSCAPAFRDFLTASSLSATSGGLPVHIAARLLGHHNLATTTQAYLAVFQDDLVRSYRAFIDQRRTCGPTAEYREPTDEEWASSRTTLLRKLEHGTCGRPYGTPLRPRARLRPLPDAARRSPSAAS